MAKSEVDEFLGQVSDAPKADPFIKEESDPLANLAGGTQDEGTKEDDKGTKAEDGDDKVLPYHKDPKLQRYIEKEVGKRIKDIKPAPAPVAATNATVDEGEEILTRIIGNDTPEKVSAIKDFKRYLSGLEEKGAQKALAQINEQAQAAQAEEQAAQEVLVEAFDSLEEEFDVDLTSNTTAARKERSEFIDFIKRISPKDADGDIIQYPDFTESYKLFKTSQKPATDNKRAKDIATRSMARSTDSGATPTGGKTWKDIDRIFSKL